MAEESLIPPEDAHPPYRMAAENCPYTYSPVNVNMTEIGGMAFLGIIACILLVSLLRSNKRNRELAVELARLTPAA